MSTKCSTPLTAHALRELVVYRDGELFWRNPVGKMKRGALGAPAGKGGRLQAIIAGRAQYIHRLVWLYHHGEWPGEQVDHVNGVKTDNRIENLRLLSPSANAQNVNRIGVSRDRRSGRWRARIMVEGRSISLGSHATHEAAHAAYLRAKEMHHPSWVTGVGAA